MRWVFLVCLNFLVANIFVWSLFNYSVREFDLNNLKKINRNLSKSEIKTLLGNPCDIFSNRWIYRYGDQSTFILTWDNDKMKKAELDFESPVDYKRFIAKDISKEIKNSGNYKNIYFDNNKIFQLSDQHEILKVLWVEVQHGDYRSFASIPDFET